MVVLCLGFHFLLYVSVDKLHLHVHMYLFALQMGLFKCISCEFCESMCMSMRGHYSMTSMHCGNPCTLRNLHFLYFLARLQSDAENYLAGRSSSLNERPRYQLRSEGRISKLGRCHHPLRTAVLDIRVNSGVRFSLVLLY